jgi:RNA polymerase-binding transcription factor DksA
LNKDDFARFEERLLAERSRYMEELGILEEEMNSTTRDSAGDLSAYSFHMADLGSDAIARDKTIQFASRDGQILQAINDALFRLQEGTYGTCARCGEPIHAERLEAVPHARFCSACQEKEEKERR